MTKPPNALAVFLSPACEGAAVLKGLVPFSPPKTPGSREIWHRENSAPERPLTRWLVHQA